MVQCPICTKSVQSSKINDHLDSQCQSFILDTTTNAPSSPSQTQPQAQTQKQTQPQRENNGFFLSQKRPASTFFQTPSSKRHAAPPSSANGKPSAAPPINLVKATGVMSLKEGTKRSFSDGPGAASAVGKEGNEVNGGGGGGGGGGGESGEGAGGAQEERNGPAAKRHKTNKSAPLAERMRPQKFDQVFGQDLVGPDGILRTLMESEKLPSMILWGGSGTGKTTIARCMAQMTGARFIELNATSSGVAECKKLFVEAENELRLTGRKTIIFCDEIHRFSKAQQDVFLRPVEAGSITLVGATTENPSFKVVSALLSRCRTFTLSKLTTEHIKSILHRALESETTVSDSPNSSLLVDDDLLTYLASFADGDARTALNLLELALSLSTTRPDITKSEIKAALTKTLVYDRAGDQHYDTISAFHKSVRGSNPDAALYYLARMLQSGEDPLFIARRMIVIASEDVGLADNTLLPLATACYTSVQQLGMPEARIPMAHVAVALSLAPKSTRAYRGLNNAVSALKEPGVAGLPIPTHLRNAPTRLMRELGYGREYKYNPNYVAGKVKQDYLPEELKGRRFLEERDLGGLVDADLEGEGVGKGEEGEGEEDRMGAKGGSDRDD